MTDPKTVDNIKGLIEAGILTTINTTISSINISWEDNIDFWWKTLDCSKLSIKLNHPYNTDYDFDFALVDEEKLRLYMTEFTSLYYRCLYGNESKLKPFRNYILEQGHRWGEGPAISSCRSYQAYKYNIPFQDKQDWNFVITTLGEYSECELEEKVDNPGGVQPDYCKDCKYKDQRECKACGAMAYPKECHYMKAWMQTLEIINNGRKRNNK